MKRRVLIMVLSMAICFILSACSITINNGSGIGINRVEESSDKTITNKNLNALKVYSAVGSIRVSTWDKDEIYVKVKKINNGLKNKSELLNELKEAEIIYTEENGILSIKTIFPKFKNNGISMEFDISVPKRITVFDIDSEVGDVRMAGITGELDVVNNVGKIDISDCIGKINLKATTGDVTLRKSILKGESTIVGNTGRVVFDGSIDSQGKYKFTTNIGKLEITLPAQSAFNIDASCDVGSIDCAFNVDGSNTNKNITGKVNGGGPELKLENNVGGISIDKE